MNEFMRMNENQQKFLTYLTDKLYSQYILSRVSMSNDNSPFRMIIEFGLPVYSFIVIIEYDDVSIQVYGSGDKQSINCDYSIFKTPEDYYDFLNKHIFELKG